MSNYSPRHSDLLARIRGYLEEAKVQLQQARTKEERNLLNEKIGFFERRQHEVRVAQRREAALRRRWERMNGRTWPHPTFPPHPSVQYLFSEEKIEPHYDDESLRVEKRKGERRIEKVPGENAFDFVQRIAREYAKIKDGDHKSVRRVLQRAYLAARKMQREPNQFERLQADPFWNTSLHKPKDASTSK
jgi:hypothetical protein